MLSIDGVTSLWNSGMYSNQAQNQAAYAAMVQSQANQVHTYGALSGLANAQAALGGAYKAPNNSDDIFYTPHFYTEFTTPTLLHADVRNSKECLRRLWRIYRYVVTLEATIGLPSTVTQASGRWTFDKYWMTADIAAFERVRFGFTGLPLGHKAASFADTARGIWRLISFWSYRYEYARSKGKSKTQEVS